MPARKAAGCATMLLFFVLQIAAMAAVVYLAYEYLAPVIGRMVLADQADFANVVAIVIGLVAACVPLFLLDRLCKRLTGSSVLDNIPHLP